MSAVREERGCLNGPEQGLSRVRILSLQKGSMAWGVRIPTMSESAEGEE